MDLISDPIVVGGALREGSEQVNVTGMMHSCFLISPEAHRVFSRPMLGALLLTALLGCDTSIYYPEDVTPPEGWVSACDGDVTATVLVQNDSDSTIHVYELLPSDRCNPSDRGLVEPGETVDMGKAFGPVWRVEDALTHDWLDTFTLVDGENVLQVLP